MSHQYSITAVKEGNIFTIDVRVNDNISEWQGGRIDGVFSTRMKDPVIIMPRVIHDGIYVIGGVLS